jgi:hypothetical protein
MPALTSTPIPRRHERRYAIVPDRATQAQYIWDPDADEWYGPFATRWDAELRLVRWRTERLRASPQTDSRPRRRDGQQLGRQRDSRL